MKRFAIVEISGHQYQVCEEDELLVDSLDNKVGDKIKLDQILLKVFDKVEIGQPYLEKKVIEAEIIDQIKGKKIRVATYKSKSRYRRVKGFRPHLTKLKITKIN